MKWDKTFSILLMSAVLLRRMENLQVNLYVFSRDFKTKPRNEGTLKTFSQLQIIAKVSW